MKSTLALLLLGLIALSALTPIVRADDDGEGSGGSGGEETPAPKPKAKPAKKAKAKAAKPAKALPKVDVPLEALSKLPVGPLAMDAAALKEDDTLFDQLPKSLSGTENVEALTSSLKRAAALLAKMKRDVEGEKVWTKNVYDIIQNYQYKYLKTVQDVKEREAKVAKMEKLVKRLKQSTLHSAVERELSKASKALGELVTRSDAGGAVYAKVTARMAKLKNALKTMPRPRQLFSETTHKMQKILKSSIPPHTSDALRELTGSAAAPKPAAKPAAKKPAAKAAKKVVAKKAAPKKAKKVVKKAPKKAKKTTKKAKKAAPKKAKKAKKAAPKKKAAEEEDDE